MASIVDTTVSILFFIVFSSCRSENSDLFLVIVPLLIELDIKKSPLFERREVLLY
jgi:hypothetical protein